MKELPKEQIPIIQGIIKRLLSKENKNDLRVYQDTAISVILERELGYPVLTTTVSYLRSRLGFPGAPARLRSMLKGEEE